MKGNLTRTTLFFTVAVLLFLLSILCFLWIDPSLGSILMGCGTVFLCLGATSRKPSDRE